MSFVREQAIWQTKLLLEFAVRVKAVGTHTNHHRTDLPEPGKRVAKLGRFLRSTGGVVLWIEEKDDVLPGEGIASHHSPVVGLEREIG
jgi:hypothetical protein